MSFEKNNTKQPIQSILPEDIGIKDVWKIAERKKIIAALNLSYSERFSIMMRLMRIDKMLSKAIITHKKTT
jgi:uncharacterized protein (DUF2344 family)